MASYLDLAATVRGIPPAAGSTRVVAIDGPAGSGKSVFAARLGEAMSANVICLDDLTPSWTGPDREAALLVEQVLEPLASGGRPRYRFFDWVKDRYTGWREVPRDPVLLIEGVGAGSRVVRPYLTYLIWIEAPSVLRLARGVERDGEERRPEWARWREREDALFRSEGTRAAADLLVDGAPTVPHDASVEYVILRAAR
jgi:uridine kinase